MNATKAEAHPVVLASRKKYVEARGELCPRCETSAIATHGPLKRNLDSATQKVVCSRCHLEWTDCYSLIGYSPPSGYEEDQEIWDTEENRDKLAEKIVEGWNKDYLLEYAIRKLSESFERTGLEPFRQLWREHFGRAIR